MLLGHSALAPGRGAIRTEFREFGVDPLFQLVIEDSAEVPSAPTFNLVRRFLVEPVEVSVVVSFAWFDEAKVKGLILTGDPVFGEETVADLVSASNCREPFSF